MKKFMQKPTQDDGLRPPPAVEFAYQVGGQKVKGRPTAPPESRTSQDQQTS